MTRLELKTLVGYFAQASGQAYITAASDINALIGECIGIYAEETLTFFDPKIALTLSSGVSAYDLRSLSIVSKKVCLPVSVAIGNATLTNMYGRPGPISSTEWHGLSDAYSVSNATPTRWTWEPPNTLRLYAAPSSAGSNNYVSGYYIPADLSADGDEVPLPAECERELALFVTSRLLDPRASGESLEKVQRLDQVAWARFQARKERAAQLMNTVYRADQTKAYPETQ